MLIMNKLANNIQRKGCMYRKYNFRIENISSKLSNISLAGSGALPGKMLDLGLLKNK